MASQPASWGGFLRLWFLLFFAYVVLKDGRTVRQQ